MTRQSRKLVVAVIVGLMGLLGLGLLSGCDDSGYGGGFGGSYVEPMDFSPYGYDYSMYDLFTSDI